MFQCAMIGLAATLLLVGGCNESEEVLAQRRLLTAIGRMRDSPARQRGPQLDALQRMEALGEPAKLARDRCVASYRAHLDAQRALDALAAELAGSAGAALDQAVRLQTATRGLDGARRGLAGCAQAVAALQSLLR